MDVPALPARMRVLSGDDIHITSLTVSGNDLNHNLIRQADDFVFCTGDRTGLDADLILAGRRSHCGGTVFYGNIIGVAVLSDLDPLILIEGIDPIKLAIYRDAHLIPGNTARERKPGNDDAEYQKAQK